MKTLRIASKTLSDAANSSDDFFQSKHINKRREERNKELEKKKEEVIYKLTKGLEEIKTAYKSKDWKDEKEKLFLELFSGLHVDKALNQYEYRHGYYLSDLNDMKRCFYDLESNNFWMCYQSIWRVFELQFNMDYRDAQSFVKDMLKEHFKLYDVTVILRMITGY